MAAEQQAGQAVGKTLPLPLLQAVVAYWFAIKLGALFVGEPHADEAYYWMWSQHLALSYLDHPPLQAWLQAVVGAVFGSSLAALRLLSVLCSAGMVWVFAVWAKRLRPDDWKPTFWLTAALFFSAPMLMLYTTVALHDRVLVLLALFAIHFFALFFAEWTEGRRRYGLLYLAALFLGLATLSKYTGALVGIGLLVTILVRRDLRGLLRNPHVYLAAALSVAIQTPVLYWNLTQGLASAQLHLSRGFEGAAVGGEHVLRILIETLVLVSPFAIVPFWRFVATGAGGGLGGMLHSSAKWVFVVSSLAVLLVAFVRDALFYWNIIGIAVVFATGAWAFRSRLVQGLQIGWGVLVTTVLVVQFAVAPVLGTPDTRGMFGWPTVGAAVNSALEEQGADFAAAADWLQASRLGFAMGDKDVASISRETDGFDFWFDEAAHAGKSAIVIIERGDARLAYIAGQFASMEKLSDLPIEHFGTTLSNFEIYLGRGYVAKP